MGSSLSRRIKAAIISHDVDSISTLVKHPMVRSCDGVNLPLNRRQDCALSLSIRIGRYELIPILLAAGAKINSINRDGETPVDILLRAILPADDEILHRHCCLYPHTTVGQSGIEPEWSRLPDPLRMLLASGGHGQLVERLVLHAMKDASVMLELCELLVDLENPRHYRLSGLLLQVAVWFDLTDCLRCLLVRGIDTLNFWRSTFVPTLVPNPDRRSPVRRRGTGVTRGNGVGEYIVRTPPADSYAIQTLKLSFVQDWRAEWEDGSNPSAQYRAGLHLTPDSATMFVRAANTYPALAHVMHDVFRFLPCSCSGPRLRDTDLVATLVLAGYRFGDDEIDHLRLKFDIDFARYRKYRTQPQPLRHLSRCVVRFNLRCNVYCGVERLGFLPASLKNCILIQDDDLNL